MSILITEDGLAIEDVFQRIFAKAGYEVILQPDGMELIEGRFEIPDLFVIDKQLPGVNGLDVCAHLKQQAATSHIPIIMVSASPYVEKLAMDAGADAFLEKPFKQKDILELVHKFLGKA
jgi:DNA-binding response OmpR family regulator